MLPRCVPLILNLFWSLFLLVGVSGLGDGVLGTIGLGWSSSLSELSSLDSEGMDGNGGALGFGGGCGPLLLVSCSL